MPRTYNGRFYAPEEPKVNAGWLIAGLVLLPTWPSFFTLVASIAFFVKYGKQVSERNLYRRFQQFCAVIGMRERVAIRELKGVCGASKAETRAMLQKMVARGYFGERAYVDLTRDELVLPDAGAQGAEAPREHGARESGRGWMDALFELMNALNVRNIFQGEASDEDFSYRPWAGRRPSGGDQWAERGGAGPARQPQNRSQSRESPQPQQRQQPQEPPRAQTQPGSPEPPRGEAKREEDRRPERPRKRTYAEELERTLNELYQLNAQIEHEGVSQRIDRIGMLTAGIFRAVIEKPEREQDVRKFMNYYLPTTLKLLRSYSLMEKQGYQSESILESRKKIEEILDTLIQGYEKLLDRLYRDDALDIATDIDVLEMMMAGDGLM